MQNTTKRAVSFSFLLTWALLAVPAAGVECVEPAGAGGCFTTIQAAVNAASPGERIDVNPGLYVEAVEIPGAKDGIELRGIGATRPVIRPDVDEDVAEGPGIRVLPGAEGVTIRNLHVRQSDFEGILVDTGALNALIDDVHVASVRGTCVSISGNGGRIEDSLLEACGSRGISIGLLPFNDRPVHREAECQPDPETDCPRADGVTVLRTTVRGTGNSSIHLYGHDVLIRDNHLLRAAEVGVRGVGNGARIIRNEFRQSGDQAIHLDGNNMVIRRNDFTDIENECLELGGDDIKVQNNNFLQCEEEAMEFRPEGGVDSGSVTTGNLLISGNTMRNLGDECIEIENGIDDVVIRDNVIEHCEDGSIQFQGDDHDNVRIEDNLLTFYQQKGIEAKGTGVLIKGNTLRHGQRGDSQAIDFRGTNGRIIDNVIEYVIGDGIEYCGTNPLITGNTVKYSNEPGIKYACGDGIKGSGETLVGCNSECAGGEISGNDVRFVANEQGYEILYNAEEGDPRLLVQNNKAIEAGDDGFRILGRGVDVIGNTARRNGDSQGREGDNGFLIAGTDMSVRNNLADGNHEDGFHVCGTDIVLRNNDARQNLEDGYDIGGDQRPDTTVCFESNPGGGSGNFVAGAAEDVRVRNNEAWANGALGIEISANVTDARVYQNFSTSNRTDFCDEGAGTDEVNNTFLSTGPCAID